MYVRASLAAIRGRFASSHHFAPVASYYHPKLIPRCRIFKLRDTFIVLCSQLADGGDIEALSVVTDTIIGMKNRKAICLFFFF